MSLKEKNRKWIVGLLFGLCIAVQTGWLVYTFTCSKEGYMADEVWSYGLANSYYRPFLFLEDGIPIDDVSGENRANMNQWIPGSVLKDYITVQPGERFRYDAVYHNQTLDHHPPLYYMLLHTVSSFFPDRFSWWYGFSLGILFFIGTQVFLFLLARELTGSDYAALLSCLFYGGGTGMLCTFAFIRQYSLLTMLCVAYTYFCLRLYRQERESRRFRTKTLAAAAGTAVLAFLTHYFVVAYIGVFTAAYCIWLLAKRRFKPMLIFGACMTAALGVFLAVYPAALYQVLRSETTGMEKLYSGRTQLRMLASLTFQHHFGFRTSYFATPFWKILLLLLLALAVAAVLLMIPFRREEWCRNLVKKVRMLPGRGLRFLDRMDPIPLCIFLGCCAVYLVTIATVDVWKQGMWAMRYVCATFPLLCMLAVTGVYTFAAHLPGVRLARNLLALLLVCCVILKVQLTAPFPYIMLRRGEGESLREMTRGKRVLVVDVSARDSVMSATCLALELSESEECFFTAADEVGRYLREVLADGRQVGQVDFVLIDPQRVTLTPEAAEIYGQWLSEDYSRERDPANGAQWPVRIFEAKERQKDGVAVTEEGDCTGLVCGLAGEDGVWLRALVETNTDIYLVLEISRE